MYDFARKYPFIMFMPAMVYGIMVGNDIILSNTATIFVLFGSIFITFVTHRYCTLTVFELIVPIAFFVIGVLTTQIHYTIPNIFPHVTNNISILLEHLRSAIIEKNLYILGDNDIGNLANTITVGAKKALSEETKQLFSICGTSHLLAVSGLHVGAIYLLFNRTMTFIGLKHRYITICVIPFVWLYTALSGASPSAIRAASILTFISVANFTQKDFTALNGIFLCSFITLLTNPLAIFDISFQLSYAAYIGIVALFPIFAPAKKGGVKILKKLIAAIALSIAAQLATLPIIAYYFHTISINNFLINLIAIPLTTIFLYIDIFILIIPSALLSPISKILSLPAELLIKSISLFKTINLQYADLAPTVIECILMYAIIATIFIVAHKVITRHYN